MNLTDQIIEKARGCLLASGAAGRVCGAAMSPRMYQQLRTALELPDQFPVLIDPRMSDADQAEVYYDERRWTDRACEQYDFDIWKRAPIWEDEMGIGVCPRSFSVSMPLFHVTKDGFPLSYWYATKDDEGAYVQFDIRDVSPEGRDATNHRMIRLRPRDCARYVEGIATQLGGEKIVTIARAAEKARREIF